MPTWLKAQSSVSELGDQEGVILKAVSVFILWLWKRLEVIVVKGTVERCWRNLKARQGL